MCTIPTYVFVFGVEWSDGKVGRSVGREVGRGETNENAPKKLQNSPHARAQPDRAQLSNFDLFLSFFHFQKNRCTYHTYPPIQQALVTIARTFINRIITPSLAVLVSTALLSFNASLFATYTGNVSTEMTRHMSCTIIMQFLSSCI